MAINTHIDQSEMAPKTIHFIYAPSGSGGEMTFPLVYFIAIKSAKFHNPSFDIVLHSDGKGGGKAWDLVKKYATIKPLTLPTSVFGNLIEGLQHKIDVARLEILLKDGGIYLDLDTICLRPLDTFLSDRVVMGEESSIGLGNAVIFAPPNAEFIRRWYSEYQGFHNSQWNEFSILTPRRLAERWPWAIHVLPQNVFFSPSFSPDDLESLFCKVVAYPEAYIFHLWGSVARNYLDRINTDTIVSFDSTYNLAARPIVRDDLVELSQDSHTAKDPLSTLEAQTNVERQVFRDIYANSRWGKGSGNGSRPDATLIYRSFLENFIFMNGINSVVDIGCGDWQSSRYICFYDALYQGFDVVSEVIERNNRNFGAASVKFDIMPVDPRSLPTAPLLIIKDVLQHMTDEQIFYYRDNVIPRYKYALITNSFSAINYERNVQIPAGQFRSLDLRASPYYFRGAYVSESWNEWERIRTMLMVSDHQ